LLGTGDQLLGSINFMGTPLQSTKCSDQTLQKKTDHVHVLQIKLIYYLLGCRVF
jgi:hypothetical protein